MRTLCRALRGIKTLHNRLKAHRIHRNIIVKTSANPRELDEIFKLRYRVYCLELGQLNPENYPTERERDKYDEYSVYIHIWHKNKLAAAMRLIKDTPWGFLMEDAFKLPADIDKKRTVEYSRGIVDKKYRNMDLFGIMLKRALEWQIENGYTTCIGVTGEEKLLATLFRAGAVQIGNAKKYHGFYATPLLIDLKKIKNKDHQ